MKKILIVLTVLCLLFASSCNLSSGNDGTETSSDTESTTAETELEYITINSADDLYDRERTHKPTLEQAQSITDGMNMREVIGILGLPHQGGPTSGVNSLLWYTDGGNVMWVTLFPSDEHDAKCSQETDLIDCIECQYNCWVVGKPHIVSATDYAS